MTQIPNMSPPKPPLPLDHHIFISNNEKLDSGRLLLGLALHTSTAPTTLVFDHLSNLSPPTSHTKNTSPSTHAYEQKQPSLTLSLLFPATTTSLTQKQQRLSSKDDITSYSNSVSIKRKREDLDQDATNNNDLYEDVSNYIGSLSGGGCTSSKKKKKLRLNKQQSALLEDNFKLHTTLNPKQKEALARQLNLRPRQVEVWFQNRRARTKLKQTEVDCELLKKCCERLAKENEKLNKELQHLKSLNKIQQVPFHNMHHLPPTNGLTSTYLCPSCHNHLQLLPPNNNPNNLSNHNFYVSSKKRFIFNPFTKAC